MWQLLRFVSVCSKLTYLMNYRFFAAIGLLHAVLACPGFRGHPCARSRFGMLPVTDGPFKPDWASLHQYQTPDWFRDAKFGIWAHWTAQCVPEQGDWYAQLMYIEYAKDKYTGQLSKTPGRDWQYHLAHYGPQSQFGFKDIDNIWHAENWNPTQLIDLYKRAGAKYFVALANHHDNFDCFDSNP